MSYDKSITKQEIAILMKPKLESLMKQIMIKTNIYKVNSIEKLILQTIAGNQFIYFTFLRNKVQYKIKLKEGQFEINLRNLIKHNFIESIECINACNKITAEFFPITDKGYKYLNLTESKRIPSRMFKHTLYCDFVAKELSRKGHKPKLEDHRIDVSYIDKDNNLYAYEITISFDTLIDNIKKFLALNGKLLTIVTEDKNGITKAKNIIKSELQLELIHEKIIFKLIQEFIPQKSKSKISKKKGE